MKLNLCKVRRREKGESTTVSHPAGDILVEESENELTVVENSKDVRMDTKDCIMKDISVDTADTHASELEHPSPPVEYVEDAPLLDEDGEREFGEVCEATEQDGDESVRSLDEGDAQLLTFLRNMSLAAISDRASFTRDFSNLQKYCNDRLYTLMSDREISLKCVREIVPALAQTCIAAAVECQTFPPLVRGCLGIQDAEQKLEQENNEFRVIEDKPNPDMPTIPTGMWVVDSINEALDNWCDGEVSKFMGGLFKLMNLTALLTYFGDSSGDKIAVILRKTSSIVSRSSDAWRDIIRHMSTEVQFEDKPLPSIPNAGFVSKCETKLDDVPDIDHVQCGEGPFKVYWAYTEKWMRKHFNPALTNSKEMIEQTRDWFNSLESSSQDLFIRLSRTLCCYNP